MNQILILESLIAMTPFEYRKTQYFKNSDDDQIYFTLEKCSYSFDLSVQTMEQDQSSIMGHFGFQHILPFSSFSTHIRQSLCELKSLLICLIMDPMQSHLCFLVKNRCCFCLQSYCIQPFQVSFKSDLVDLGTDFQIKRSFVS